jgi:CheY-like chemotaxis protein
MAHLESLVILDAAGKSGAALAFGFERGGLKVYATRDADDAFSMARTRVPQLIVVALDGGTEELSLIGRLREEPVTRELPIVAVGEGVRREESLRVGADEFVTRPAFIRDVITLSRLAVAVRQDGDEAGVVGMLEDYGLYFLVRALAVARRSGVLELERGRRQGEVHFAKGAVVAARVGRMSGVAAFQHLLLWGEAAMTLRFESPAGERKIVAHVDELLEKGAIFARQFESLAVRVGGAQAIYTQEPRKTAEARAQIPTEVMALVKQYDGRKPLIDIVEDSPFKAFDSIKITYRLAELGVIARRHERRDVTPLSAQLAVRDWLLGAEPAAAGEAPRGDAASGVTEAGRRAAEAYAEEMAARAAEPSPADDILNDTSRVPTLEPEALAGEPAAPEAAAPRAPLEDTPTAPRESKRGPTARNKKKKGAAEPAHETHAPIAHGKPHESAIHDKTHEPIAHAKATHVADAHAKPHGSAIAAKTHEPIAHGKVDGSANGRAQTQPPEAHAHKPEAHAHKPEAHAHKPEAHAHKPEAHAHKPEAHAHKPEAHGKPVPGKLSPTSVARAVTKEPVFDDLEEEFFAREADLARPPTVDTFEDLDASQPRPKLSPRRNWFGFKGGGNGNNKKKK